MEYILSNDNFPKFKVAYKEAQHYHAKDLYGDRPYFEYHLLGVVQKVYDKYKHLPFNVLDDLLTVAVLHDIHEDHKYPIDLIISKFGYAVSLGIIAISYVKNIETREQYYTRCAANWYAKCVKEMDAQFNKEQSLLEGNKKRAAYYSKAELIMSSVE